MHTASLKCYGQCLFCIQKNVLTTECSLGAAHAGVEDGGEAT